MTERPELRKGRVRMNDLVARRWKCPECGSMEAEKARAVSKKPELEITCECGAVWMVDLPVMPEMPE